MIKSFGHKGLQAFFERGTKAGIRPDHAPKDMANNYFPISAPFGIAQ
jgi:plasmid maintenance system killer protein